MIRMSETVKRKCMIVRRALIIGAAVCFAVMLVFLIIDFFFYPMSDTSIRWHIDKLYTEYEYSGDSIDVSAYVSHDERELFINLMDFDRAKAEDFVQFKEYRFACCYDRIKYANRYEQSVRDKQTAELLGRWNDLLSQILEESLPEESKSMMRKKFYNTFSKRPFGIYREWFDLMENSPDEYISEIRYFASNDLLYFEIFKEDTIAICVDFLENHYDDNPYQFKKDSDRYWDVIVNLGAKNRYGGARVTNQENIRESYYNYYQLHPEMRPHHYVTYVNPNSGSSHSNSGSYSGYGFDVEDYYDPGDFADDNEDYFDSWDDAYDYWENY